MLTHVGARDGKHDQDVDWRSKDSIRKSRWFHRFEALAMSALTMESQEVGFNGIIVIICINGGAVSDVAAEALGPIIEHAIKDDAAGRGSGESGNLYVELHCCSYAEFIQDYDNAGAVMSSFQEAAWANYTELHIKHYKTRNFAYIALQNKEICI